jgi:hypothetical protein
MTLTAYAMADGDRAKQSARVREIIRRFKEKNRPRTLEEMKNAGRGSRALVRENLRRRAQEGERRRDRRKQSNDKK